MSPKHCGMCLQGNHQAFCSSADKSHHIRKTTVFKDVAALPLSDLRVLHPAPRPASASQPYASSVPLGSHYQTMSQTATAGAWDASRSGPRFGRKRCPDLMATVSSGFRGGSGGRGGVGAHAGIAAADDATSYCTTSYTPTSYRP
jgi:hypothetical protein